MEPGTKNAATVLSVLGAVGGAVAAVAQIVDYAQAGKLRPVLIALCVAGFIIVAVVFYFNWPSVRPALRLRFDWFSSALAGSAILAAFSLTAVSIVGLWNTTTPPPVQNPNR